VGRESGSSAILEGGSKSVYAVPVQRTGLGLAKNRLEHDLA
jgi:hypothetical protein